MHLRLRRRGPASRKAVWLPDTMVGSMVGFTEMAAKSRATPGATTAGRNAQAAAVAALRPMLSTLRVAAAVTAKVNSKEEATVREVWAVRVIVQDVMRAVAAEAAHSRTATRASALTRAAGVLQWVAAAIVDAAMTEIRRHEGRLKSGGLRSQWRSRARMMVDLLVLLLVVAGVVVVDGGVVARVVGTTAGRRVTPLAPAKSRAERSVEDATNWAVGVLAQQAAPSETTRAGKREDAVTKAMAAVVEIAALVVR